MLTSIYAHLHAFEVQEAPRTAAGEPLLLWVLTVAMLATSCGIQTKQSTQVSAGVAVSQFICFRCAWVRQLSQLAGMEASARPRGGGQDIWTPRKQVRMTLLDTVTPGFAGILHLLARRGSRHCSIRKPRLSVAAVEVLSA